MPAEWNNSLTLLIMAASFGLVLTLWLMGVFLWHGRRQERARELEGRLHSASLLDLSEGSTRVLRLWKDGQETTTTVPTLSRRRLAFTENFRRLLRDAGVNIPPAFFLLGVLGVLFLLCALVLIVTHSLLSALALCLLALTVLRVQLGKRVDRHIALFENQLADSLELCARSLRAGHPLIGSFRIVAQEMPAPASTLFGNICMLEGLGLNLENAIKEVAGDSGSADMRLFATSVSIQLRSGGNLADMMHRLADVIRDRIRLKRRVRVLTAQAQLSRRILTVLPFVLLGLLTALNPNYMAPLLHTTTGRIMLAAAGCSIALGIWIMNRISTIRT